MAVEAVFSLNDVVDLRRRQNVEELVVVDLLYALQFHFCLVAFLYGLLAAFLVAWLHPGLLSLPFKDGPLFLLHFLVDREELCSFLMGEPCLLSNEMLQFSIKLFW